MRLAWWITGRAGESLLGRLIGAAVSGSVLARFATAITASLLWAGFVALVLGPLGLPSALLWVAAGAAVAAAVNRSGAGGGLGPAVALASIWGLLLGLVVDAIVGQELNDRFDDLTRGAIWVVAWVGGAVGGWAAGSMASGWYDRHVLNHQPRRLVVAALVSLLSLGAIATLVQSVVTGVILRHISDPVAGVVAAAPRLLLWTSTVLGLLAFVLIPAAIFFKPLLPRPRYLLSRGELLEVPYVDDDAIREPRRFWPVAWVCGSIGGTAGLVALTESQSDEEAVLGLFLALLLLTDVYRPTFSALARVAVDAWRSLTKPLRSGRPDEAGHQAILPPSLSLTEAAYRLRERGTGFTAWTDHWPTARSEDELQLCLAQHDRVHLVTYERLTAGLRRGQILAFSGSQLHVSGEGIVIVLDDAQVTVDSPSVQSMWATILGVRVLSMWRWP